MTRRTLHSMVLMAYLLSFSAVSFAEDLSSKVDAAAEFTKTLSKNKTTENKIVETVAPVKEPMKVAEVKAEPKLVAKEKKAPAAKDDKDKKKEDKDLKKVEKKLSGIVTFIRKNKMAVEFASGEEIFLTVDPSVKLNKAKSFSDIGQFDKVSLKYLETSKPPKVAGAETMVLSMTVKEITLDKKAASPAGLSS